MGRAWFFYIIGEKKKTKQEALIKLLGWFFLNLFREILKNQNSAAYLLIAHDGGQSCPKLIEFHPFSTKHYVDGGFVDIFLILTPT